MVTGEEAEGKTWIQVEVGTMLWSERIVVWTIWILTAAGVFFSLRRLFRRKRRKR
jgi:hypothetical protein